MQSDKSIVGNAESIIHYSFNALTEKSNLNDYR